MRVAVNVEQLLHEAPGGLRLVADRLPQCAGLLVLTYHFPQKGLFDVAALHYELRLTLKLLHGGGELVGVRGE